MLCTNLRAEAVWTFTIAIKGLNYILKHITTENSYILQYIFYCIVLASKCTLYDHMRFL